MNEIAIVDERNDFRSNIRKWCIENKEKFSDVKFVVAGSRLSTFRCIVGAMSSELHKLVYEEHPNQEEIVISDFENSVAFKCLLDFCMTGQVCVSFSEAVHLLHLAEKYNVVDLENQLFDRLMDSITVENSFDIYCVATTLEMTEITRRCRTFFEADPFRTVLDQPDLKSLPREAFEEILLIANMSKHDKRRNDDELAIFNSIIQWSKGNSSSEDFKQVASELVLKYINFMKIGPADMIQIAKADVLDPMKLLKLQCFSYDPQTDISGTVPSESATLSTLIYDRTSSEPTGFFHEPETFKTFSSEPSLKNNMEHQEEDPGRKKRTFLNNIISSIGGGGGTCLERNRIGPIDLRMLLTSKDVETNIHVPYLDTHDGGACFDPNNERIWSHCGNDNNGKKIYCTDLKTNTSQVFPIPFGTHGGYPIFDPIRNVVYVFEQIQCGIGGRRLGCFFPDGKFNELKKTTFDTKGYSIPSIHFDRIWHLTNHNNLCYYHIERNEWKRMKAKTEGGMCSFHEFEGDLWVMDDTFVYKYDLKEDKLEKIYAGHKASSSGENKVCFSLITSNNRIGNGKNGFVIVQISDRDGFVCVVDPMKKKSFGLKWKRPVDSSGHWFLRSKTKELYYRTVGKWHKVKLANARER